MTNDELEQALLDAAKFIREEGGAPRDMFHPDYGWVMIDGEITEEGQPFFESLTKDAEKK